MKIELVSNSTDFAYGKICSICGGWIQTNRVAITIGTTLFIHRNCMINELEKGPKDYDEHAFTRIVSQESQGKGLLARLEPQTVSAET